MIAASNIVDEKLLIPPITKSLLVPCSIAYPLRISSEDTTLSVFYQDIVFNVGQIIKCHRKDEALIEEVKKRERALIESF